MSVHSRSRNGVVVPVQTWCTSCNRPMAATPGRAFCAECETHVSVWAVAATLVIAGIGVLLYYSG